MQSNHEYWIGEAGNLIELFYPSGYDDLWVLIGSAVK